jgi:threonine dehydratase
MVRDFVDKMIVVSEKQIAAAMVHAYRHERLVVEGGGSVGIAALLHDLVPDIRGHTAVVLSGNNVDMDVFGGIVGTRRD